MARNVPESIDSHDAESHNPIGLEPVWSDTILHCRDGSFPLETVFG